MAKFLRCILNLPHKLMNFIEFKRKKVSKGRKVIINGRIFLHGDGKFVIGDGVHINSSSIYNPTAGKETHLMSLKGAVIKIGNNSGISNSRIISRESVVIEEDVLVGADCVIMDNDMHSLDYQIRKEDRNKGVDSASIVIKSGAFIGARCIILKGVTIGERSVIGAGSVVTKNIPNDEIWAGNPARFIKRVDGVKRH